MDFHFFEFNGQVNAENQFLFQPHQSNFHQIFLYLNGEGNHKIDFLDYKYQPFALIPLARGQVQMIECLPQTKMYVISFSEQFLYCNGNEIQWLNSLNLYNSENTHFPIYLGKRDFKRLFIIAEQMKSEFYSLDNVLEQDILRDLLKLFLKSAERYASNSNQPQKPIDNEYSLFCSFKNSLETYYKTYHSVKEYADMIFVTPKKLNQITHQHYGQNAKMMIEDRVMLEVKRLLVFSTMNLKEIALETGFTDPANFNKFFKRHTQTTPANFRLANSECSFLP